MQEQTDMEAIVSLGEWVRRRRKALDLTQENLARQVGYSAIAIRKIEAGERRPSRQVARLLAAALELPAQEQALFMQVALGEQRVDRLSTPQTPVTLAPSSSTAPASTLPLPLTPLIGRQLELAALCSFVSNGNTRLVTLTGAGGVGKTRLALQVAAELQNVFADGVYFAPLAALREPALLIPALAQALRIREMPGDRSLFEQITGRIHQQHLLLLLDNFEHLVVAAPVIADLLTACPRLYILVTSREPLHLHGEQEYLVPPLALPLADALATPESALRTAAVQLFVQRAQAVRPDFTLTADNVAAILQICTHLDGVPLAIELAAARMKLLSPNALLEHILGATGARFALLTGGARDAPSRHQTLHGAIDWSYALLTPPEQTLLRRLAIFVGGWTVAAAETICDFGFTILDFGLQRSEPSIQNPKSKMQNLLDGLASLVDKSLVHPVETANGEDRFSLLETVREYGLLRLVEAGEPVAVQRAHAHYFVDYAERAALYFEGPERFACFDRLATEAGNLHAAHEWIVVNNETTLGLRYGLALWPFWDGYGRKSEGRQKLATIINLPGAEDDPRALAAALIGAGHLAESSCDHAHAKVLLERSLALARGLDDRHVMLKALFALGLSSRAQGDYERAKSYYEQGLDIARTLNNSSLVPEQLEFLAIIAHLQNQDDRAVTLFEEGLALANACNDRDLVSDIFFDLAWMACNRGDEQARTLLNQANQVLRDLNISYNRYGCEPLVRGMITLGEGDPATARQEVCQSLRSFFVDGQFWGVALSFESLAIIAAAEQQVQRAFTLAGAAAALRRATQTKSYSHTANQLATALASLLDAAGPAAARAAQAVGEQMTLEAAVAFACE
jgi:predicted ATPase/transcriptional regulator with XRE-family HTH domain